MPTTDPTPIPAEAIEAVISAMDRHITDEFDGLIPVCRCGSREDDHEARVILAAAAPILLAAGRTAAAAPLLDLISDLSDFGRDPCSYDHHGNCQAHGWTTTDPRCPYARAKELFDEIEAARVAENGADRA